MSGTDQTCKVFDGLDGLDCPNPADKHGICEHHQVPAPDTEKR